MSGNQFSLTGPARHARLMLSCRIVCNLFLQLILVLSHQEAYAMLNRFEVSVAREEIDGVDTLRYSFEKLLAQAVSVNEGC